MDATTIKVSDLKLAIIGLGYVGLPLAVEFGKKRSVIGFDINHTRVDELKSGQDHTLETTREELNSAVHLSFTTRLDDLRECNCFIVTVPTPIDEHKQPDLTPLFKASEVIGKAMKRGTSSSMNLRFIRAQQKKIASRYWNNTLG